MAAIDKIRTTMKKFIAENPATITVDKYTLKDNGYGIMIPDTSVQPTTVVLGIGRIARRRLPDPIVTDARSPYDYNDVFYLLVEYDTTWLHRGMVFTYGNQMFRTLLVEDRIMFGEIAFKLCDLEQTTPTDGGKLYE